MHNAAEAVDRRKGDVRMERCRWKNGLPIRWKRPGAGAHPSSFQPPGKHPRNQRWFNLERLLPFGMSLDRDRNMNSTKPLVFVRAL
mmetsp:Transcript_5869/g.36399  ORF Transcript_5869/g.36399 Transcript_5869/m.36399 type:complete len:86 (+) Transcript_5869:159-416(+)